MEPLDELEDISPPLWRRGTTWVLLAVVAVAMAVGVSLWRGRSSTGDVLELAGRQRFDSAWKLLDASHGSMSDCSRYALGANLAWMDPGADTVILRLADSLRGCRVPADSIAQLAALGKWRVQRNAKGLDTSSRWKILAASFGAASACIKADSGKRICYVLGRQALEAMGDPVGESNWSALARARWPRDTAFAAKARN